MMNSHQRREALKSKRPIVHFGTLAGKENDQEPNSKRARRRPSFDVPLEDVYQAGDFASPRPSSSFQGNPLSKDKLRRTNDFVHGSIPYSSVIAVLADTLPFQRLRDLKQLGTADQAYINCTHNRFEHSFGVYHLAVEQCDQLRRKQPLLRDPVVGLTQKDRLAVSIAGLLHDLGHGPYSHTYERSLEEIQTYLKENPQLEKEYKDYPPIPADWHHEDMSIQLIDAILLELGLAIDLDNLDQPLKQVADGVDPLAMRVHDDSETLSDKEAVLTSRDFVFIKEAIYGKPIPAICEFFDTNTFVGKPWPIKEYLYSIVSNAASGLDGDKLDYLARDESKAIGDNVRPQYRLLEESYVARTSCVNPRTCHRCKSNASFVNNNKEDHYTICFPKKMAPSILDTVFLKRRDLHKMIYRHHTVECANLMVCDIFKYADPYLRLPLNCDDDDDKPQEQNGRAKPTYSDLPLSRAMLHEKAYLRLRDGAIMSMISNSSDPKLRRARRLVDRYQGRDLYKMATDQNLDCDHNDYDRMIWKLEEKDMEEEIIQVAANVFDYQTPTGAFIRLAKGDFMVKKTKMHCGLGAQNPLKMIRFLEGDAERAARRADTFDQLPIANECDEVYYQDKLPRTFESRLLRVYVRNTEKRELAKHAFMQWYDSRRVGDMLTTTIGLPAQSPVQLTQDSIAAPDSTPRRLDTLDEPRPSLFQKALFFDG